MYFSWILTVNFDFSPSNGELYAMKVMKSVLKSHLSKQYNEYIVQILILSGIDVLSVCLKPII